MVDHYARHLLLASREDADSAFRLLEERLLTYDIFPPALMKSEVCSGDGRVQPGTTIVQRVAIGPLRLEAAVRVARVWRSADNERQEVGFMYATLRGHPERGVSTFRLRRDTVQNQITFSIDARSRPGSLLTQLARPIARRFQRNATKAALAHFLALKEE